MYSVECRAGYFVCYKYLLFGGESVQADSVARGDDYPLHYKNGSVEIDQWRMYSRQCTSLRPFV